MIFALVLQVLECRPANPQPQLLPSPRNVRNENTQPHRPAPHGQSHWTIGALTPLFCSWRNINIPSRTSSHLPPLKSTYRTLAAALPSLLLLDGMARFSHVTAYQHALLQLNSLARDPEHAMATMLHALRPFITLHRTERRRNLRCTSSHRTLLTRHGLLVKESIVIFWRYLCVPHPRVHPGGLIPKLHPTRQ